MSGMGKATDQEEGSLVLCDGEICCLGLQGSALSMGPSALYAFLLGRGWVRGEDCKWMVFCSF